MDKYSFCSKTMTVNAANITGNYPQYEEVEVYLELKTDRAVRVGAQSQSTD